MAKLLIIHGVGSFNSEEVLRKVGTFVPSLHLEKEDVFSFNWDTRVNRVFGRRGKFELNVLSRMSEGALRGANLGFSSGEPYAGIPRPAIVASNACLLSVQSLAIFWLPLLLAAFVIRSAFWAVIGMAASLLVFSLFPAIVSKHKMIAARAVTRRLLLTCLWPIIYFLSLSIVGLTVLALLFGYLRFGRYFQDQVELLRLNALFLALIAFALRILLALVGFLLGLAIEKVAQPLLKVISDVLRYIGLFEYRERLQKECAECLTSFTRDYEHLTICAHSLGSVIVVDTLLRYPDCLGDVKRLDLVTMGSPLKRFFSWGFPDLFASPSEIHAALSGFLPEFRWINVYRPFDLIGGAIGSGTSKIEDTSTGQWFKNHTNYWGDLKVTEKVDQAFTQTPYFHAESRSVENWPASLAESSYGPGVDKLWRNRHRVSEYLILALILTGVIWFLKNALKALGMFWAYRDSVFDGALLIILNIIGPLIFLRYLKQGWSTHIVPFLRSFYGTLPDNNPTGIPDPSEVYPGTTNFPWRRFWLTIGISISVLAIGFAWILYLERSWTQYSEPLRFADASALSLSDSGLLQAAHLGWYVEYALPQGRTHEVQVPNGQYIEGFTMGSGYLVLERGRCVVAVDIATSRDISKPYCNHPIPAGLASVSGSGRFTAIVSASRTEGPTTFHLLVSDGSRLKDKDFGEVNLPIKLQFGSDECLYYSQFNQILRICNLEGDGAQVRYAETKGNIAAFFVNSRSNLLATIEDNHEIVLYRGGKRVSHMWNSELIGSGNPLIAISPDGRIIAVSTSWKVSVWNWRSYSYIGRLLAPSGEE